MEDILAQLLEDLAEVCGAPILKRTELVDGLITRARFLKNSDLRKARTLIETTTRIAKIVGSGIEQRAEVMSAWGEIARAAADWDTAEACYALVEELIKPLGEDHGIRVETDLRIAVLSRDLRDFWNAEALARKALRNARSASDLINVKKALLVLASTIDYSRRGDPEILALHREAVTIKTTVTMERYCLANLAHALILDGHHLDEAADHLQRAQRLEAPEDPVLDNHIGWSYGLLHAAQQDYQRARHHLEAVVQNFIDFDRPLFAAICLMDLAILHLGNGAYDEAKSLASRLWPLFQNLRIDREAFAAVNLYMKASARGELTAEVVRGIKRQLELAGPNIPPAHAR